MTFRTPFVALAGAAALALPVSAGAAQSSTLTYSCKFPLVGTKVITVALNVGVPDRVDVGGSTGPIAVTGTIAGHQLAATTETIDDVGTLEGTITLDGRIRTPSGAAAIAPVTLAFPATQIVLPGEPQPSFVATGTAPSLTLDEAGPTYVDITSLGLNLTVRQSAGNALEIPPVTKDLDGNLVLPTDDDPNTYDAHCKPSSITNPTVATIVAGDGPLPSVTPAPTPVLPTPTPQPTPPPTPGPVPAIDPAAVFSQHQCKWSLQGVSDDRVASLFGDPAVAGDVPFEIWWQKTRDVYGEVVETLEAYEGRIDVAAVAVTPGGLVPIDGISTIDGYAFTKGATGTLEFHSSGSIPRAALPAGTTAIKLVTIKPSLRLIDAQGETIVLPPITFFDGIPNPDDGNPETIGVPCRPTPVTTKLAYSLQGSTTLTTMTRGALPLTGAADLAISPASGDVVAGYTLNDTQGRLTALGFLPVTATLGFVTSGPTIGKLEGTKLTTTSRVRIKVKSVKAFGAIPIAGGNGCQTKNLSNITLSSTAFDPLTGGTLSGVYAISSLNNCGPLNGIVSPVTAGEGNTISLKFTPKA